MAGNDKKRLLLANRLLKQDGVLIVTIDDNEVANLEVLLREMFSSSGLHLVVIEHNKRGRPQVNFAPTHEYAYFIIPSNQQVIAEQIAERDIRSINLRRTGNNSGRTKPGRTIVLPRRSTRPLGGWRKYPFQFIIANPYPNRRELEGAGSCLD